MIYVIISPVYIKKGDYTRFENALKIGYSSDKKKTYKGRFSAYNTENPTCEVLFKIIGGTRRDEKNLHKYFSKYQKRFEDNDTREWFEYCSEIIEFFKINTTIDSIRKTVKPTLDKKSKNKNKGSLNTSFSVVWPYILSIKKITGRLDYSILEDYSSNSSDDFCEIWVKTYYKEDSESILNYYNEIQSKVAPRMEKYIDYLRNPKNGQLPERLKHLCENDEFTEDEKIIIAQQVSEKFDQYYNMVGSKRCAELGYNTTYIRNEIKNLSADQEKLSSLIYVQFSKGCRYAKSDIKNKLKKIYEVCNITANPKATDLGKYFDLKQVLMSDPNDKTKKINGFELLSKK